MSESKASGAAGGGVPLTGYLRAPRVHEPPLLPLKNRRMRGLCCHAETPIDYLTYVRGFSMIQSSVMQAGSAETVGDRLKRLRLHRRLSQRDLSSPGVSYAY